MTVCPRGNHSDHGLTLALDTMPDGRVSFQLATHLELAFNITQLQVGVFFFFYEGTMQRGKELKQRLVLVF